MENILKFGIDIKVLKSCLIIPYSKFVADCMIFYKANRKAAQQVIAVLGKYCNV